ncbi:hypothetical protein [Streptomyces sp. NPDC005507]|uniref:AMP-binding enzyme n=1 Tax=unclassified Streptomyces TaxID=2593676 RepID=UPI0033AD0E31
MARRPGAAGRASELSCGRNEVGPVPLDTWGEEATAVVVLRPGGGQPTEQELIDFTREKVASYKRPR